MKKAFTLIEILIVVILLGILAAVVIPQFVDQTAVVNKNAAATEVANLNSAWQQFVAAQMASTAGTVVAADYADFAGATAALVREKYIDAAPATDKYDGYTLGFTTVAGTPMQCKFTVAP